MAEAVFTSNIAVLQDTDADTTVENDVFGREITLTSVTADNAANAAAAFLYIKDAKTITAASVDSDFVFMLPGSATDGGQFTYEFDPANGGHKFSTGVSFYVATTNPATGTPTGDPGSALILTMVGKL